MAQSKYDKVRSYYERGLWSINRVRDAVAKDWITREQFEEITGVPYKGDSDG